MRSTLKWQHVAPSAPDTLACYPYKDRDPFYVQNTPNVYFAGGQPEFASEVFESSDSKTKTLLVSVPDFSTTGTIALVNIETLQCFPVEFKA
jgi:DNA polymerase delta subunit 2